ncbi:extracellular solute-binding protein, partial [marine sediment metagenome]
MAMFPYSKPKYLSHYILSFGILLILSSVFSLHALASTECKALRTAGAQQWFPYAFNEFDGKLKATGIAFDVLTLLSQDLGITLKIETGLPWKRIESKLDAGELDILAGNYWNETRSRKWLIT